MRSIGPAVTREQSGKGGLGAAARARFCRRCRAGAARNWHERAPGPVTASGMDCGSIAAERPKCPPSRRRLLPLLAAGRVGGPGGRGNPARRLLPALPGGPGALRPGAQAARGGAARASPLLLLLLVPCPRRAAAASRRPPADWERPRAGPPAPPGPPAGRGGVWRSQPGLAPGLAGAAGALPRCLGRVAALASSRRGESRAGAAGAGQAGRGRRSPPGRGTVRSDVWATR